jgi:hypothetical protein
MASRAATEGDTTRRAERLRVDEAARLRPNSWSSVEAQMLDLSELGFRASCEARLQVGSCVSLEIPGVGPVDAQVEWQRGGEFGARFLTPIDLSHCDWTLGQRHKALAHLLVQRARAQKAGRGGAEAQLRREILSALPMRRQGGAG